MENSLPPCHLPYLFFDDGVNRERKIICSPFSQDDDDRGGGFVVNIPELDGKQIIACNHGWLVLTDLVTRDTWSLWDPASLQEIKLPQLQEELEEDCELICTLTAPPPAGNEEADECIVLILCGRTAMCCRPGDEHWTKQSIEYEVGHLALSKGVIYGLGQVTDTVVVVEVDMALKSIRTLMMDEKPEGRLYPFSTRIFHFIVNAGGELFVAFIGFLEHPRSLLARVESISIQKLDLEGRVWVEAESINDHAVFLAQNFCMSCPSPELGGAEKNCLYVTLGDHPDVYCYRMEDKSLTTISPCEKKLREPWYIPSWVLPYYRSTHNPHSRKEERIKDVMENNHDTKDEEGSCNLVKIWRKDVRLEFGTLLSNFYRLPFDVIGLLGTRLKIMDYLSFRSVCKEFHAASPLPVPIDRRNHTSLSPWLMFVKNAESTCTLVDPIQNSWYLVTIPPHLVGGRIMFSNKEGVIICKGKTSCHFYHPFTKVTMELPPYDGELQRIAFTSVPTSLGSVTVAISVGLEPRIDIARLLSTNQEWRFSQFPHQDYFYIGHNSPVFHDGTFCLLDQTGSLGVLKLTEDEPEWEVLSRPQGLLESIYGNYIVECDGQLLAVFLSCHEKRIQTFKFNDSSREWDHVDDLCKYMLFLSRKSSFGVPAPSTEMGNRIIQSNPTSPIPSSIASYPTPEKQKSNRTQPCHHHPRITLLLPTHLLSPTHPNVLMERVEHLTPLPLIRLTENSWRGLVLPLPPQVSGAKSR